LFVYPAFRYCAYCSEGHINWDPRHTHTHTTHTHTLTHVFALPQNYDAAKEVVVASTDPYYANLIPK